MIADILTALESAGLRSGPNRHPTISPMFAPMTAPVAIAMIFISGFVAIPALGRWRHQVTEGLAFLLATVVLVTVIILLCDLWPDYYASPQISAAMTENSSED